MRRSPPDWPGLSQAPLSVSWDQNTPRLSRGCEWQLPGLPLHVGVAAHGSGVAGHCPLSAQVDRRVGGLGRVCLADCGEVEAHLLTLLIVCHHHGHSHVDLLVWTPSSVSVSYDGGSLLLVLSPEMYLKRFMKPPDLVQTHMLLG